MQHLVTVRIHSQVVFLCVFFVCVFFCIRGGQPSTLCHKPVIQSCCPVRPRKRCNACSPFGFIRRLFFFVFFLLYPPGRISQDCVISPRSNLAARYVHGSDATPGHRSDSFACCFFVFPGEDLSTLCHKPMIQSCCCSVRSRKRCNTADRHVRIHSYVFFCFVFLYTSLPYNILKF